MTVTNLYIAHAHRCQLYACYLVIATVTASFLADMIVQFGSQLALFELGTVGEQQNGNNNNIVICIVYLMSMLYSYCC